MVRPVSVLVTYPPRLPARWAGRLEDVAPNLELRFCPYEETPRLRTARGQHHLDAELRSLVPTLTGEQRAAFGRAEVLLGFDLPLGLGELAPALRWVQAIGAGTDHFWGAGLGPNVAVTTAAGVAAVPIAEFVIGRLLAVWKRFDELAVLQRDHVWEPTYGSLVAGRTISLVGFGAIGRAIAERARALSLHVVAVRRHPDRLDPLADEVYGPGDLCDVLSRSDAVVVCAPSTPDTSNLIDADALAAMRPDAIFCNVARGALVDEQALVSALRAGHLRAAILDVTREEPLPSDSPLWDVPRLLISPHSSAALDGYLDLLLELFADNFGRYLRGEKLRNLVDRSAGE